MKAREPETIIVVDDEDLIRRWLKESLRANGYSVEDASRGAEALRLAEQTQASVVLLDLRLPDASGLDLLPRFHDIDPDVMVVIITAHGEISTAVEAVKAGAYDFLEKPIDLDKLKIVIEKGLETRRLRRQVAVFREQHRWLFANVELVGRSTALRGIVEMVEKVAPTDSAILLEGESGVGKDIVARAIHARSKRRDNAFVEINCTALPEHLAESELFGHERGAYTDARERKRGLVELAEGGTLFLDELGDMPLSIQAKLLRFLEDSKIKRIGGTTDISVDSRVIGATNRNLEKMVAEGTFRADLFYRLQVVPIRIPPLRERPEDIAPLAVHFVERLSRDLRREPVVLTTEALDVLEGYDWPGNVRQLMNVLERVMILEATPEIRPEHLPQELAGARASVSDHAPVFPLPSEGLALEDVERDLIEQAMARMNGNVTRAAALLGISRDTLRYRLEKHERPANTHLSP
ncbi:MAG: sigma-54 dependent transcriptional regulator [Gemmatimonadales bacterium]